MLYQKKTDKFGHSIGFFKSNQKWVAEKEYFEIELSTITIGNYSILISKNLVLKTG